jgi:outer membrane protein assembly factor BamB/orotate phosphoribosyltransferase
MLLEESAPQRETVDRALLLRDVQLRIVDGIRAKLRAAGLGLAGDRYNEFVGNQRAIGYELATRLIVPLWGAADYEYQTASNSNAAGDSPRLKPPLPLAFGHTLGGIAYDCLYRERCGRAPVSDLAALFNLGICLFDRLCDHHPDQTARLPAFFNDEILSGLCTGSGRAEDLLRDADRVEHPELRVLLKTIAGFFRSFHRAADESAGAEATSALRLLLLRAYRAEMITTRDRPYRRGSEFRSAVYAKSVLPFEVIATIAGFCGRSLASVADREAALAVLRAMGRAVSIADDVADMVADFRSGDANEVLAIFDGPAGEEVTVGRVVASLQANVLAVKRLTASIEDGAANRHFDAFLGYLQEWLGLADLIAPVIGHDSSALSQALLSEAIHMAEGISRSGSPCPWIMDARAALLRSEPLQVAVRDLWRRLRYYNPTAIGGLSLGADPVIAGLLLESFADGRQIKGFIARQSPKRSGLCKQVEGPELDRDDRVAIVDDVIGGGGSLTRAAESIRPSGATIVAAAAVVDLCKGGSSYVRSQGIPVETLYTSGELGLAVRPARLPDSWRLLWSIAGMYRGSYVAPNSSPSEFGGLVFAGSDAGYVTCLDLAGNERWRFTVRDSSRGVLGRVATSTKSALFGAFDGFVYCVDVRSGALNWETQCANRIVSSVTRLRPESGAVFASGSVDTRGVVVALSARTGRRIWEHVVPAAVESSPTASRELNLVVFGSNDGIVSALSAADGKEVWNFATDGAVRGSAAVDRDGRCFVGSEDGYLYCLCAATGRPRWRKRIANSLHTQPLLSGDLIVSGGDSQRVFALEARTGAVRWIATLRGAHTGGATLVTRKLVAIGCDSGYIYLLDAATGHTMWTHQVEGSIRTTPGVAGGLLLVPCTDGRLYCFSPVAPQAALSE